MSSSGRPRATRRLAALTTRAAPRSRARRLRLRAWVTSLLMLSLPALAADGPSGHGRATDADIVAQSTGGFFTTRDPAVREEQARASIARLENVAATEPGRILSARFLFRRGIIATEFVSIFGTLNVETQDLVLKAPENDRGQVVTTIVGAMLIAALGDESPRSTVRVVECVRARFAAQGRLLMQRGPLSAEDQEFAHNQARIATSPDLKVYVAGFLGSAADLDAARRAGAGLIWTVAFDPRAATSPEALRQRKEFLAMSPLRRLGSDGCPQQF